MSSSNLSDEMKMKLHNQLNLQYNESATRLDNDMYIFIDGDEIPPDSNNTPGMMYNTFGSNFKLPNIN